MPAEAASRLASVRGKIGYVPAPNGLIYGTGGVAFAHASSQSLDFSESARAVVFEGSCVEKSFFHAANTFSASANQSMLGWAIGAGIDWKWQVDARSAWVFQYFNFPTRVAPALAEKAAYPARTRSVQRRTRGAWSAIPPPHPPLAGASFARSLIRAAAGFRSRADDRRRLLTHETAEIETALSLLWFAAI
jgi:hypothetical protein